MIRLICSRVVHYLRHRIGPWKRRNAGALSPIGGARRPRSARSAGIVRRHDHEPPGLLACRFRMPRAISKYCPAQASAGFVTRGSDKIGAAWTCHRSQESARIRWCRPPGRSAVGDGAEQPGLAAGTRTRPATHPPIARGIRVPAPPQASRGRREPCPDRSPGKPVTPHRRRGVPPGRPARHPSLGRRKTEGPTLTHGGRTATVSAHRQPWPASASATSVDADPAPTRDASTLVGDEAHNLARPANSKKRPIPARPRRRCGRCTRKVRRTPPPDKQPAKTRE
ncbi:UNVERIFIED_ORG: hypothetical protein GGE11_003757 [Mycolicibacterium obuense]